MSFLNNLMTTIYQYAEQHSTPASELLQEIERVTYLKTLRPRMLSGHLQGQFLRLISQLTRPRRILEIGTFTGYSAICLSEGLSDDGLLYTIEADEELEYLIQNAVNQYNMQHKIKICIGDALKIIPTIHESFDIVFIDAGKRDYLTYYDLCMDKLNKGGLIIADNVLWSGKVVAPAHTHDKDTQILDTFNKTLFNDPRVETLLLPLRDGLMLARKL